MPLTNSISTRPFLRAPSLLTDESFASSANFRSSWQLPSLTRTGPETVSAGRLTLPLAPARSGRNDRKRLGRGSANTRGDGALFLGERRDHSSRESGRPTEQRMVSTDRDVPLDRGACGAEQPPRSGTPLPLRVPVNLGNPCHGLLSRGLKRLERTADGGRDGSSRRRSAPSVPPTPAIPFTTVTAVTPLRLRVTQFQQLRRLPRCPLTDTHPDEQIQTATLSLAHCQRLHADLVS